MKHRQIGYSLLSGRGLEIGGLHQPAPVPKHCEVEYWDAMSAEEAARIFPELDPNGFTPIDRVVDLDTQNLAADSDYAFDFVIFNHVIEHVANPVKVIEEIFRITKAGGLVILSAPDKDFTFDKPRALTSFEHVWNEHLNEVDSVTDEHYEDFLRAVHPETLASEAGFRAALGSVRARREHAHVWDSESFRAFLQQCLEKLALDAKPIFECYGADTAIEYFGVWRKIAKEDATVAFRDDDAILENLCNSQLDLIRHNKTLERASHEKDTHIHNMEAHNAQAMRELEARNLQISDALAATEARNAQIGDALAAMETRYARLSTLAEERDKQFAALLNSRSWKITAPLRLLKARFSARQPHDGPID